MMSESLISSKLSEIEDLMKDRMQDSFKLNKFRSKNNKISKEDKDIEELKTFERSESVNFKEN